VCYPGVVAEPESKGKEAKRNESIKAVPDKGKSAKDKYPAWEGHTPNRRGKGEQPEPFCGGSAQWMEYTLRKKRNLRFKRDWRTKRESVMARQDSESRGTEGEEETYLRKKE